MVIEKGFDLFWTCASAQQDCGTAARDKASSSRRTVQLETPCRGLRYRPCGSVTTGRNRSICCDRFQFREFQLGESSQPGGYRCAVLIGNICGGFRTLSADCPNWSVANSWSPLKPWRYFSARLVYRLCPPVRYRESE